MSFFSTRIPYRQTNAFSLKESLRTKLALDYIDQAETARSFYQHPPTLQGIQKAIQQRKGFNTDRETLVNKLKEQYSKTQSNEKVNRNIQALLSGETFTVTTAHQNNIFTGPLYFIYKIIHAIRLADHLTESLPQYHFVPVFYIGTEDADLDELNHIWLGSEKLSWNTRQTGAVGRMKIDKDMVALITRMEGQLSVLPHGKEVIELLRSCYQEGVSIQDATFSFVNNLFAEYGLIVLLPDEPMLKKQMIPVFKDDLLNQTASDILNKSTRQLENAGYRVQAHPREINLFWLEDAERERIIKNNREWSVVNANRKWNEEQILKQLNDHPENFSPNVILRGLYQETILPNVAFIGGAGETSYWLQFKELFEYYHVPFPVLVLRNSFMILESKLKTRIDALGISIDDLFLPEDDLINKIVSRDSKNNVGLNGSVSAITELYESFKKQATAIDGSLEKHVDALKTQTLYRLQELEKKMLRAEKRKFSDQQRQVKSIKQRLFPSGSLQERKENFSYYYAKWGKDFLQQLYSHSPSLEHEFVVLTEKQAP